MRLEWLEDILAVAETSSISEAAERVTTPVGDGDVPYIAYPSDVFLSEVLERRILPRIRDTAHPSPRAETALTLAAVEMALAGIAGHESHASASAHKPLGKQGNWIGASASDRRAKDHGQPGGHVNRAPRSCIF